jgi:hypothetical protein
VDARPKLYPSSVDKSAMQTRIGPEIEWILIAQPYQGGEESDTDSQARGGPATAMALSILSLIAYQEPAKPA